MQFKLFCIGAPAAPQVYVVAMDSRQATEIYYAQVLADVHETPSFTIARCDDRLGADLQAGLHDMLKANITGVASFDPMFGSWRVMPSYGNRQ